MVTRVRSVRNILMELRKVCQHPYLQANELEPFNLPEEEQHKQLVNASGKLQFLKLLLPELIARGHRILLFSQFKIALDRIQDFLYGENIKHLRLDGDTQQAQRQKSMDIFNAEGSTYHVFLLTTRAGGVGINLATADTIILHDPDFNPHQDLQAIARAHRYGQKKNVLVFKLMVKGSVEETIISKGKKKMVLDHLVVQQMGKESSEDHDFEDLFIKGVEGIYSGQGGINVPDINYNSKNVAELIDKVEKDAEEEERKMKERKEAIARGELEFQENKQAAQFGFAKIWEADQNQLQTSQIEEEKDEEEDVDWDQLMASIQAEREARQLRDLQEGRARRKANHTQINYRLDDDDPIPGVNITPKKGKSKLSKNKSKNKVDKASSDTEYVNEILSGEDDDKDDAGLPEVPDEGLSDLLPTIMNQKNVPFIPKSSNINDSAMSQAKTDRSNFSHGGLLLFTGQKREGEPWGSSNKKVLKTDVIMSETSQSNLSLNSNNQIYQQHPPVTEFNLNSSSQYHKPPSHIIAAQNILQWLYLVTRRLNSALLLAVWANIGILEAPIDERINAYISLSKTIDAKLVQFGEQPFFTLKEQMELVAMFIRSGWPVVLENHNRRQVMLQEKPYESADIDGQRASMFDQSSLYQKTGVNDSSIASASDSRAALTEQFSKTTTSARSSAQTPITTPQLVSAQKALFSLPQSTRESINELSSTSSPFPASLHSTSNRQISSQAESASAFNHPHSGSTLVNMAGSSLSTSTNHQAEGEPVIADKPAKPMHCDFCLSTGHVFESCPNVLTKKTLETYAWSVIRSDISDARKQESLRFLQRMRDLLVRSNKLEASYVLPSLPQNQMAQAGNTALGNDATVTMPAGVAENCSKKEGVIMASQMAQPIERKSEISSDRPKDTIIKGFVPSIFKGDSVEKRSFRAEEAMPVDSNTCPFCDTRCGLSVRECVQIKANRKALKNKIRILDEKIKDLKQNGSQEDGRKKLELGILKKMQLPLFECYKSWPRT
ncbi:hypothetical protein L204_105819 [Cryptococcus depauperatus]